MRTYILIAIIFISLTGYSQGKDELVNSTLKSIYSANFDSSKTNISILLNKYPNDPQINFLNVLNVWWKINIDKSNTALDNELDEAVIKTIDICDEKLDANSKDFNSLLYKGGAVGYRGLVKSIREKWLAAVDDGHQALNLLYEAQEINPASYETLLGIGIYNYFAEYVPERYPFLKPLMILFPKGDKFKGLAQIKDAMIKSAIAKYEANFILAYLNLQYERNFQETENYTKTLLEEFPNNPVFKKLLYSSYIGMSRFEESLNGWSEIREKSKNGLQGYNNDRTLRDADYYIAYSLQRLGRIDEVYDFITEAERLNTNLDKEDNSYKAFTYMILGNYYDKKGDRNTAISYYKKILDMKEMGNSHSEANKFIKNPYR